MLQKEYTHTLIAGLIGSIDLIISLIASVPS